MSGRTQTNVSLPNQRRKRLRRDRTVASGYKEAGSLAKQSPGQNFFVMIVARRDSCSLFNQWVFDGHDQKDQANPGLSGGVRPSGGNGCRDQLTRTESETRLAPDAPIAGPIAVGLQSLGITVEAVPDPRFRCYVLRLLGILFNLLSQVLDEHPEIIHLVSVVRTPNGLQQFAMWDRLVCVERQVSEQVQLLRREPARRRSA